MDILLKERLVSYYEKHILEDVMPFWDRRCIDKEYGGYITCFDREGKMTDDKKYIWFQGRQLYIYSLLYNKVRKKKEWLENAKHGFSFLVKYGYAGDGRWNYVLDRKGNVLEGTISIFSLLMYSHISFSVQLESGKTRISSPLWILVLYSFHTSGR